MVKNLVKLYLKGIIDNFVDEALREFSETHSDEDLVAVADFTKIIEKKLKAKMEEMINGLQKI